MPARWHPARQQQLLDSAGVASRQQAPSCSSSVFARGPNRGVAARAAATDIELEEYQADNFYEILGVGPLSSPKDIKRAYKTMMKDFHPDLSGDDESTEFCILLNEIYETLMDPERRATYDALAGFSANSINPFMDTSLPADQVFVDEFTCIGCRNCTNVCPSSFAIEEDYGRARVMRQGVDTEDKLQEAIDTCPVSCIHWVTASQLSLLEASMARMERVAVWSLMSGGGGGRDVFNEASIAWEKRQAAMRAKLQREEAASAFASWWSAVGGASAGANMYAQAASAARRAASGAASASSSYDGGDNPSSSGEYDSSSYGDYSGYGEGNGDAGPGTKEGARIAKLAAKAARAARQWKSWQELQRRGKQSSLLLTATSSQD
uniref:J domain-containing protein n=1 Tax=Tetradesmus obliquus TaxID=3088 RepID=A0A383VAV8_TETOB|eukprot:jgi/Sobl393_1/9303/SZX61496.1